MPKRKHADQDFLQKTYAMLEEPSLSSIISWDEAGTAFEIKDVSALSSVLPHYQLSDYASFLRLLRLFDFRREPGRCVFSRPDFTRAKGVKAPEEDYRQLVHGISWLQRSQSALKQEIASLQDNHHAFKETNARLQAELQRFRERRERIEQVLSRFYHCTKLHQSSSEVLEESKA